MGLLADLTHEHQQVVHATGTGDPHPSSLPLLANRFKQRCVVFFIEDATMGHGMGDTFRYSMYSFMLSPQVLF